MRIPIFLVTGFLGSGKTTLLNHLVRARPETRGRLAIVVNEFGDVGIDGDLLPSSMTRQVELPGGCICCVLNEELDSTITTLIADNPDIGMIIIETTGIAEPLPISWSLAREPLNQSVRLAAVITVVDALNFLDHRPLAPAVDNQVEYADLLVVSKTDVLGRDNPDSATGSRLPADLVRVLDALNPTAARIQGDTDAVTATLWQSLLDPPMSSPDIVPRASSMTGHDQHSDHAHHGEGVGHAFETVSLSIDNLLDFEELSEQLEALPANYVRIKGIARVIDESTGSSEPHWVAFHRVGTRVSCEPLANPSDSRIVALGSRLEPSALSACVEAAVIRSESSMEAR